MIKKILIGTFATLIVGAASVSAYNSASTPTTALAQNTEEVEAQTTTQESFAFGESQSQDQAYGQENEQGTAQDNAQAQGQAQGQAGGETQSQGGGNGYQGGRNETVDSTRGGGQSVGMEMVTLHGIVTESELVSLTLTTDAGDTLTVSLDAVALGITLLPDEGITLGGYWNLDGTFTVGQINLDSTGETYAISGNSGNSSSGYRGGGSGGGGKGSSSTTTTP